MSRHRHIILVFFYVLLLNSLGFGADQAQWGQRYSRNMVSSETDLPSSFDLKTGRNVKWTIGLGSETWSTPVVAAGKILIGTNNHRPRDPRHQGDRGILLCLNEADGSFCWQLVAPKIQGDRYKDWPGVGMVSPATVENNCVYMVTNRNVVMCLDIHGQANGNDGPCRDEGRLMVLSDEEPLRVTSSDADILWTYDIPAELGIYPHDSAHSAILIHEQFLYINTSSGLNGDHDAVRVPDAPSLIVLDKESGRLVAQENEGIGHRIFHSTWSSPALGVVNNRPLVFFGGGDGIVYAFNAVRSAPPDGTVQKLQLVWRFDCDPEAPKENIHTYIRNRRISPSNIKSMPVFYNNRVYVTVGGDIWWGKHQAWLKCIDATGQDDITESGELWSYPLKQHCCSTPSIQDDLVFVADCGKTIHCIGANTGKAHWLHPTKGAIWGSTLVADGKVYVGNRRREFLILAATPQKQILHTTTFDSNIVSTPTAANGVLYITTMNKLYALKKD